MGIPPPLGGASSVPLQYHRAFDFAAQSMYGSVGHPRSSVGTSAPALVLGSVRAIASAPVSRRIDANSLARTMSDYSPFVAPHGVFGATTAQLPPLVDGYGSREGQPVYADATHAHESSRHAPLQPLMAPRPLSSEIVEITAAAGVAPDAAGGRADAMALHAAMSNALSPYRNPEGADIVADSPAVVTVEWGAMEQASALAAAAAASSARVHTAGASPARSGLAAALPSLPHVTYSLSAITVAQDRADTSPAAVPQCSCLVTDPTEPRVSCGLHDADTTVSRCDDSTLCSFSSLTQQLRPAATSARPGAGGPAAAEPAMPTAVLSLSHPSLDSSADNSPAGGSSGGFADGAHERTGPLCVPLIHGHLVEEAPSCGGDHAVDVTHDGVDTELEGGPGEARDAWAALLSPRPAASAGGGIGILSQAAAALEDGRVALSSQPPSPPHTACPAPSHPSPPALPPLPSGLARPCTPSSWPEPLLAAARARNAALQGQQARGPGHPAELLDSLIGSLISPDAAPMARLEASRAPSLPSAPLSPVSTAVAAAFGPQGLACARTDTPTSSVAVDAATAPRPSGPELGPLLSDATPPVSESSPAPVPGPATRPPMATDSHASTAAARLAPLGVSATDGTRARPQAPRGPNPPSRPVTPARMRMSVDGGGGGGGTLVASVTAGLALGASVSAYGMPGQSADGGRGAHPAVAMAHAAAAEMSALARVAAAAAAASSADQDVTACAAAAITAAVAAAAASMSIAAAESVAAVEDDDSVEVGALGRRVGSATITRSPPSPTMQPGYPHPHPVSPPDIAGPTWSLRPAAADSTTTSADRANPPGLVAAVSSATATAPTTVVVSPHGRGAARVVPSGSVPAPTSATPPSWTPNSAGGHSWSTLVLPTAYPDNPLLSPDSAIDGFVGGFRRPAPVLPPGDATHPLSSDTTDGAIPTPPPLSATAGAAQPGHPHMARRSSHAGHGGAAPVPPATSPSSSQTRTPGGNTPTLPGALRDVLPCTPTGPRPAGGGGSPVADPFLAIMREPARIRAAPSGGMNTSFAGPPGAAGRATPVRGGISSPAASLDVDAEAYGGGLLAPLLSSAETAAHMHVIPLDALTALAGAVADEAVAASVGGLSQAAAPSSGGYPLSSIGASVGARRTASSSAGASGKFTYPSYAAAAAAGASYGMGPPGSSLSLHTLAHASSMHGSVAYPSSTAAAAAAAAVAATAATAAGTAAQSLSPHGSTAGQAHGVARGPGPHTSTVYSTTASGSYSATGGGGTFGRSLGPVALAPMSATLATRRASSASMDMFAPRATDATVSGATVHQTPLGGGPRSSVGSADRGADVGLGATAPTGRVRRSDSVTAFTTISTARTAHTSDGTITSTAAAILGVAVSYASCGDDAAAPRAHDARASADGGHTASLVTSMASGAARLSRVSSTPGTPVRDPRGSSLAALRDPPSGFAVAAFATAHGGSLPGGLVSLADCGVGMAPSRSRTTSGDGSRYDLAQPALFSSSGRTTATPSGAEAEHDVDGGASPSASPPLDAPTPPHLYGAGDHARPFRTSAHDRALSTGCTGDGARGSAGADSADGPLVPPPCLDGDAPADDPVFFAAQLILPHNIRGRSPVTRVSPSGAYATVSRATSAAESTHGSVPPAAGQAADTPPPGGSYRDSAAAAVAAAAAFSNTGFPPAPATLWARRQRRAATLVSDSTAQSRGVGASAGGITTAFGTFVQSFTLGSTGGVTGADEGADVPHRIWGNSASAFVTRSSDTALFHGDGALSGRSSVPASLASPLEPDLSTDAARGRPVYAPPAARPRSGTQPLLRPHRAGSSPVLAFNGDALSPDAFTAVPSTQHYPASGSLTFEQSVHAAGLRLLAAQMLRQAQSQFP